MQNEKENLTVILITLIVSPFFRFLPFPSDGFSRVTIPLNRCDALTSPTKGWCVTSTEEKKGSYSNAPGRLWARVQTDWKPLVSSINRESTHALLLLIWNCHIVAKRLAKRQVIYSEGAILQIELKDKKSLTIVTYTSEKWMRELLLIDN